MNNSARFGKIIFLITFFLIIGPSIAYSADAKPEGTLRMAWGSLAEENFLCWYGGSSEQARFWAETYEYLFYKNEKTREDIFGLAERAELAKDAMSYTIHIRKGVPWQDGWGNVSAADVKYTFERIMSKESTSEMKKRFKAYIKGMQLIDNYTLKFSFKKPCPEFQSHLSLRFCPILCKKYIETVGEEKARGKPVGSGPYRLVEHKFGNYLKWEAVDKHWRIVPEFKYLYQYIIPEESTRFAMLKTKKLDLAMISQFHKSQAEKIPWLSIKFPPGGYTIYLVFGGLLTPPDPRYKEGYHSSDPWKDIRVREAMAISIDREAICKALYKGAARPTTLGWLFPGWQNLPPIPYNPQKAKRLLAEAGYPNGFSLNVIGVTGWNPADELPKLIEIIAGYWEQIGLKCKIKPMDKPELLNIGRKGGHVHTVYGWKDIHRDSWAGKSEDRFKPGAAYSHFQSPEIAALIDDYESEYDMAKRKIKLAKIRDYHYKNWVTIPVIQAHQIWAYNNKKMSGDWPMDMVDKDMNVDYIRHAKPLNTWRLFEIE